MDKCSVETTPQIFVWICGGPSFEKWPKIGSFWPKLFFSGNIRIKYLQAVTVWISKISVKLWPNFGTMPKFGLVQDFYGKLQKFLHHNKHFYELYQI